MEILCVMVFSGAFSGCIGTHLPSAKEIERIKSGEQVIVLLRVTFTTNTVPKESIPNAVLGNNLHFSMGGFETGGLLKRVQSIFLSDHTRQEGWTYFMLEPGLYYLSVSFWSIQEDASNKPIPSWKLDIPSDTILMYAGTLHLVAVQECGLFGMKKIPDIVTEQIDIVRDEEIARQMASEYLSELGTPKTIPLLSRGA